MVECYGQMLGIRVTLRSNFLHHITLSQTAFVTQWYYVTCLFSSLKTLLVQICLMMVGCVAMHACQICPTDTRSLTQDSRYIERPGTLIRM